MSDPLRDAFASLLTDVVRAEIRTAMAALVPEMVAAVQAAPNRKPRISLSEARSLLAGGCRLARLLDALKSGALRGEQLTNGKRPWSINVDDLHRWDAAGRPVKPTAIVRRSTGGCES